MQLDWKTIVSNLPDCYSDLFFGTFDNSFKECPKCTYTYPKHSLFFMPHKAVKDGYFRCKECMNNFFSKIIKKEKEPVYKALVNIFKKELVSKGVKMCYGCRKLKTNDRINFSEGSYCRECSGKQYKPSLYGENVKLKDNGLKKCKYCLEIKDISEFHTCGVKSKKVVSYCYNCETLGKLEKSNYDRKYLEANYDIKKAYYDEWKRNGGKLIRQVNEQHRISLKKSLVHDLTPEEWSETISYFDNSCAYCGINEEQSIHKFESVLSQDHIIPVSKNGPYTKSNIIPACKSCNSKKNAKDLLLFYEQYEFFTYERLAKIQKFLELHKILNNTFRYAYSYE